MSRITESLIQGGIRIRKASQDGAEGAVLRRLIDEVFVKERQYLSQVKEDCWDAISQYYLLTAHDEPMGCIRIADHGAFVEVPDNIPRSSGRVCFPMEESFPLDAHVGDAAAFTEPGRTVVLPALRNRGAFVALTGTAYLYTLRRQKSGAVCMASPEVAEPYLKMGWTRLAEPLWIEQYGSQGHPLIASPKDVGTSYQTLFLDMEQAGVITI